MTRKFMNENLDLPVRELLPIIQNRLIRHSRYFGIKALQSPTDFWIYQEIIFENKPDVIIEIGNFHGGSTLALAHMLDAMNTGRIIAIDIDQEKVAPLARKHERISWLEGDAIALFDRVKKMIRPGESVMIIEDSAHTYDHTLAVLRHYGILVTNGQYLIVEDTICYNGLDIGPKPPNAFDAVKEFLDENEAFNVDRTKENLFLTWNPNGYLVRVKA